MWTYDQIDDAILVQAAQDGDLAAFEVLVRRHQAAVYRVGLRMLDSPPDAQDVTQETFVRAWRSLDRFRGESSVSTWLYRIVTRRCLDVIMARRPADKFDESQIEPTGADLSQDAEHRAQLRAVVNVIAGQPADQRAVLVLREFEGLSYEQLAEVLGTSVAAVKGRLHRARVAVLKETASWQ